MRRTEIDLRSTGHTRFRQLSEERSLNEKWKETTLDVRRVKSDGRDETQIEIDIQRCVSKKATRVYREMSSFIISPQVARELALTICPELATGGQK